MISRSSEGRVRCARAILADEQGAVLVFVALFLLVMLGTGGLALDMGHGYLAKVRLARAVDAGALAAARSLRQGEEIARAEAEAVAAANGIDEGIGTVASSITFGVNERGENTANFSAVRTLPTFFIRFFGIRQLTVAAEAEAAVPPLDIVLVLDTSGSLADAGAWNDLRQAASSFVQFFSDRLDRMGLVSFQLVGANRHNLNGNFKVPVTQKISHLNSAGDTNVQEGLRLAREQITGPGARDDAAKVVVFFTDGRPTAVRGSFGGQDRIAAVYSNTDTWRGYFNNPNGIPPGLVAWPGNGGNPPGNWPGGCRNNARCFGLDGGEIREMAADAGLDEAAAIRQEDVLVYSIGLGNFNAWPPGDIRVPDLDYLREIANEGGVADPDEPQGKMYFAPTGVELHAVFKEVAEDLVVRLAR